MNKIFEFIIKNKKYVIIGCSVLILTVILSLILGKVTTKTIDLDKVLTIESIDNKLLKGHSTDRKIASKYSYRKSSISITNNQVKIVEMLADLMTIKSKDMNALIIQGRYEIFPVDPNNADSLPPLIQVNQYMNDFRFELLMHINNGDINIEPTEEKMHGESQYKFPLLEEESIYLEHRLYSLTYEINNDSYTNKYDFNYYMDGDNYLICEFIKYLD